MTNDCFHLKRENHRIRTDEIGQTHLVVAQKI